MAEAATLLPLLPPPPPSPPPPTLPSLPLSPPPPPFLRCGWAGLGVGGRRAKGVGGAARVSPICVGGLVSGACRGFFLSERSHRGCLWRAAPFI